MSEFGTAIAEWGFTYITIDCEIAGGKARAYWNLDEVDVMFVDEIINAIQNLRWRQEQAAIRKAKEKKNEQKE